MPTGDYSQSGSITVSSTGDCGTLEPTIAYTIDPSYWWYPEETGIIINITEPKNNKKGGDDDMRYLYEVILVNPKNDSYSVDKIVAKTETSALLKAYNSTVLFNDVDFDDLKISCRALMEWKKEKSLKKAIETIKKAVE